MTNICKRFMKETAIHESAHAVVAYRFGHYLRNTSIIQEGGRLGMSNAEYPPPGTPSSLEYIVALYAGYEAQRKYNSNADIAGSSEDNEKAAYCLRFHPGETETSLRQKARKMVKHDWHIIEAIASLLIKEKELDGDDLGFIVDSIDEGEDWKKLLNKYRLTTNQQR
jgi:hypothetical protein